MGRRSDRNARAVIEDVICRGRVVGCPLIATDGFEYYVGAVGALLGLAFNRSMQRIPRVYLPASDSRVSCVAAY